MLDLGGHWYDGLKWDGYHLMFMAWQVIFVRYSDLANDFVSDTNSKWGVKLLVDAWKTISLELIL